MGFRAGRVCAAGQESLGGLLVDKSFLDRHWTARRFPDRLEGVPGRQQVAGDRKTLTRINRLITEAAHDPSVGTGKPERLSGDLTGFWSRRIDQEHRLV